ncbi:MAG TPA: ABC transporter ATP-binding protein [Stellaceae bacterium]|jgi:lipoprotein-releasing system ATP-binding protein|nr:ABC transporter ATP-binding protein [Stellaceae bacterium]
MSDQSRMPALELRGVVRTYKQAGALLPVLRGASLAIAPGEIAALVGPSGAGKSTLLHTAGLLERPDSGEVLLAGRSCGGMSDSERTEIRRAQMGFVYQFHHLLPEFSALENVMLPQLIAGVAKAKARARAQELLGLVGLAARAEHRPARLSGGEQQRVAIVRALANSPRVLLGDEPTGNLDIHTADDVMAALIDIVRRTGLAAIIATHNLELARRMDRILSLEDGVIVERTEVRARAARGD